MYGNQLERVVLFGSRARGDARPDSDYDVAVFLKALPDRWAELDRLARLRVEMVTAHPPLMCSRHEAAKIALDMVTDDSIHRIRESRHAPHSSQG
jgi:predicted nucleotidyltransferase